MSLILWALFIYFSPWCLIVSISSCFFPWPVLLSSVISWESTRVIGTFYLCCSSGLRLFTHFSYFVFSCQCLRSLSAGKIENCSHLFVLVWLARVRPQTLRRTEKQFSCNCFSSSDLNSCTKQNIQKLSQNWSSGISCGSKSHQICLNVLYPKC